MISQFHCGDKQFGNSYVRVCVVSNYTMGLFWVASFIGYYENEQERGSKFAPSATFCTCMALLSLQLYLFSLWMKSYGVTMKLFSSTYP